MALLRAAGRGWQGVAGGGAVRLAGSAQPQGHAATPTVAGPAPEAAAARRRAARAAPHQQLPRLRWRSAPQTPSTKHGTRARAPADRERCGKAVENGHHEVEEDAGHRAAILQVGLQALPPVGGLNHIQTQLQQNRGRGRRGRGETGSASSLPGLGARPAGRRGAGSRPPQNAGTHRAQLPANDHAI